MNVLAQKLLAKGLVTEEDVKRVKREEKQRAEADKQQAQAVLEVLMDPAVDDVLDDYRSMDEMYLEHDWSEEVS